GRATLWLGRPAGNWFIRRGIEAKTATVDPAGDIQQAPLFPVLPLADLDPDFLRWLFTADPGDDRKWSELWCRLPRLSAQDISRQVNVRRLYAQRSRNLCRVLPAMHRNHRGSIFFQA